MRHSKDTKTAELPGMGQIELDAADWTAIQSALARIINAPRRRGRPPHGEREAREQAEAAARKVALIRATI